MPPSGSSFSNVVAFTANQATLDDLDKIQTTLATRRTTLDKQRANAIQVGQTVTITNTKTAYFRGMTGTVDNINVAGRGKPRAKVRLDAKSTDELRLHTRVPANVTEEIVDLPLVCLIPQ
jgi:hypothetical protein